jgi:hypothetical protein
VSSDAFDVRVRSVRGAVLELEVLPSEPLEICASRSFALLVLNDAGDRAFDYLPGDPQSESRQAEVRRLTEAYAGSPLRQELQKYPDWYAKKEWMAANLDAFIVSSTVIEKKNELDAAELRDAAAKIEKRFGGALPLDRFHEWQPLRWARCFHYTLRVELADSKWAEHVVEGREFGSTAYDVLLEETAPPVASPPPPSAPSETWTKKTRAKVHGSRTPHPLDARPPALKKDWADLARSVAAISFESPDPGTLDLANRALVFDATPPSSLDPAVERFRYLAVPTAQKAALLRSWARIAGPSFWVEVLRGTSPPIHIAAAMKGGGRSTSLDVSFSAPSLLTLAPASNGGVFATALRRILFSEFDGVVQAAAALHPEREPLLVYALARDEGIGRRFLDHAYVPANQWVRPHPWIVASLHDPQLAIEYLKRHTDWTLGERAFDVVELLGKAAIPVFDAYFELLSADPFRGASFDRDALEAAQIARRL